MRGWQWFQRLVRTDRENAELLRDCKNGRESGSDEARLYGGELAVVNRLDAGEDIEKERGVVGDLAEIGGVGECAEGRGVIVAVDGLLEVPDFLDRG